MTVEAIVLIVIALLLVGVPAYFTFWEVNCKQNFS